ncbi:hypothetical protein SNEBB_011023 [Seison nebaliae]|nr:hypothetical protein SNEBB_011023 [Seison nebaliae]
MDNRSRRLIPQNFKEDMPTAKNDEKRTHHNYLEKRRRHSIKESFALLKESVPILREKAPRAAILKKSVAYISLILERNHELDEWLEHEKTLAAKTEDEIKNLLHQVEMHQSNLQPDEQEFLANVENELLSSTLTNSQEYDMKPVDIERSNKKFTDLYDRMTNELTEKERMELKQSLYPKIVPSIMDQCLANPEEHVDLLRTSRFDEQYRNLPTNKETTTYEYSSVHFANSSFHDCNDDEDSVGLSDDDYSDDYSHLQQRSMKNFSEVVYKPKI